MEYEEYKSSVMPTVHSRRVHSARFSSESYTRLDFARRHTRARIRHVCVGEGKSSSAVVIYVCGLKWLG